jgi:hypothetical protein
LDRSEQKSSAIGLTATRKTPPVTVSEAESARRKKEIFKIILDRSKHPW